MEINITKSCGYATFFTKYSPYDTRLKIWHANFERTLAECMDDNPPLTWHSEWSELKFKAPEQLYFDGR
jgi:hypothetical protein